MRPSFRKPAMLPRPGKRDSHLPARHIGRDLAHRLVRRMLQLEARATRQELKGEIVDGIHARRGIKKRRVLRARVLDQLLQGLRGELGANEEHHRHFDHKRYGDQLRRGVARLLGLAKVHLPSDGVAPSEGVAVGRRFGRRIGREDAGGARAVLHDHRLAPAIGKMVSHAPGHEVREGSGAPEHQADRFGGKSLGPGRARYTSCKRGKALRTRRASHASCGRSGALVPATRAHAGRGTARSPRMRPARPAVRASS